MPKPRATKPAPARAPARAASSARARSPTRARWPSGARSATRASRDPLPPRIRRATLGDLPAIQDLEAACFQDYRQASPASLRRSLAANGSANGRQSVWVVDAPSSTPGRPRLWALLVAWRHPHRLRIYDIATHPDARGQGLGRALMQHAEELARKAGCSWLTLEAEELDPRLVGWYESQGFRTVARLADYYHAGCSALRMVRPVAPTYGG